MDTTDETRMSEDKLLKSLDAIDESCVCASDTLLPLEDCCRSKCLPQTLALDRSSLTVCSGVATHFIPDEQDDSPIAEDKSCAHGPLVLQCPLQSEAVKVKTDETYPAHSSDPQTKTESTEPLQLTQQVCSISNLDSIVANSMNLSEYIVNGVSTLPSAYVLLPVLKTFARNKGDSFLKSSIVLEDVSFPHVFQLGSTLNNIDMCVTISLLSGHFEVSSNDTLLAMGSIKYSDCHFLQARQTPNDLTETSSSSSDELNSVPQTSASILPEAIAPVGMVLRQQDIYKELSLKGYQLGEAFQVLKGSSDLLLNECDLSLDCTDEVQLVLGVIEAAVQMGILHNSSTPNRVYFLSKIDRLTVISPVVQSHPRICYDSATSTYSTASNQFSLSGLQFVTSVRHQASALQPRIEKHLFQPYIQSRLSDSAQMASEMKTLFQPYIQSRLSGSAQVASEMKTLLDIVVENTHNETISVLHVLSSDENAIEREMIEQVENFSQLCSTISVHQEIINSAELMSGRAPHIGAAATDLIVATNISGNPVLKSMLCDRNSSLLTHLPLGGFVLTREPLSSTVDSTDSHQREWYEEDLTSELHCVARRNNSETASMLLLYHHVPQEVITDSSFAIVEVSTKQKKLPWIAELKKLLKLKKGPKRIYGISDLEPECPSGILGLINCLRLESYGDRVRCVYLSDLKMSKPEFYSSSIWHQIRKGDLLMNVIRDDQLGSYRHLPLREITEETVTTVDLAVKVKVKQEANVSSSPTVPQGGRCRPSPLRSLGHLRSRYACHSERCYIITGGLGGFGLELASWLAGHGVRKLVLTSRSGVTNAYQARKLAVLRLSGVDIIVSDLDVSQEAQAFDLLQLSLTKSAQSIIGGIFHLAVVLRDCKFESQTVKRFQSVLGPKLIGAVNLDGALHQLSTRGYHVRDTSFVVFSSASCGLGHATQSSYAFANSSIERLCEERQKRGLHGLAIQWGAIGDVGLLYNMMGGHHVESIGGTRSQPLWSCLESLETILTLPLSQLPVVSCYVPSLSADQLRGAFSKNSGALSVIQKLEKCAIDRGTDSSDSSTQNKRLLEEDVSKDNSVRVGAISDDCACSVSTCSSQSALVNTQTCSEE